MLFITGWSVNVQTENWPKKLVFIVAPHTSNWDFVHTFWLKLYLPIKTNYVAKKNLFKFPLGLFFKAVGGAPIERTGNQNQVSAIADIFSKKEEFRLALAPEGTRKKAKWKTGFYHIAKEAKVPLVMVKINYLKKTMIVSKPIELSNDQHKDFEIIKEFYLDAAAKYPEQYEQLS